MGEMSANGISPSASPLECDGISLFILAHPDDELAFSPLLDALAAARRAIRLVYLTDGATRGVTSATRNAETISALGHLGIAASHAHFLGQTVGIADGQLHRHLDDAFHALKGLSDTWGSIDHIYSFAWEGGHEDHDAALIVAAAFASAGQCTGNLWQLPFYRASDVFPAPVYTLAAPLSENGAVVPLPISARQRRLPRELIRFYPSQRRTFLGLGPLIIWHSLTRSHLPLQPLNPDRLRQRPTARPLLYERRSGISFDEFDALSQAFLAARNSPAAHAKRIQGARAS